VCVFFEKERERERERDRERERERERERKKILESHSKLKRFLDIERKLIFI